MSRYLALFICFLGLLHASHAQRFRYLSYQGGDVPFQKVNQVVEDNKGFIWLGTDQGLFRFNGMRFEDFNISLESRYIKSFTRMHQDTLLFSNDSGIFKLFYQDKTPQISPWLTRELEKGQLGYPTQIFWDSQNRLWIGQLNGSVGYCRGEAGNCGMINLPGISKSSAMVFGEDQFGNIWIVVSGSGLYRFVPGENKIIRVPGYDGAQGLWIGGDRLIVAGQGIYDIRVDAHGRILTSKRKFISNTPFTYVTADGAGRFYLVSEPAIFTVDDQLLTLKAVYGSNDPHRVEQLPFSGINHLYFSSDQMQTGGTLWVSTNNSLGLLYTSYFKSVVGMAHDNVLGMAARGEQEVLISQGNVFSVNTQEKSYEQVPDLNRVTAMATFGSKSWFATAEGVIKEYNRGVLDREYNLSKRGGGIFYMKADHRGDVWFCQAPLQVPIKGIAKITRDGNIREYGEDDGFQSRILVADEGGRNELYVAGIGTTGYLFAYDREQDVFVDKSRPFPFKVSRNFEVHDLAVDQRGLVWLATTDGLLRYDTERIQRIPLGPYTLNEVRSVCAMPDGTLWLATDTSGLLHLDQDLNYVLFDEASGTPSKIAAYRSILLDKENRLWTGTAEGIVYSSVLNPRPMRTPKPVVQFLTSDSRGNGSGEFPEYGKDEEVQLQVLTVTYPGEGVRHQYKYFPADLAEEEIQDLEWTDVPVLGELRLGGLNPGQYTLRVRAQKPGGFGWSGASEQRIVIRRSWYTTPWGILLLAIGAGLFFWYGIRLWVIRKTRQLRATLISKEKELHQKEEELSSKMNTLKVQRQELKTAGVTIYLLSRLLRQIPPRATWKEVLPILCKLVELPTGMDAFELAFESGNDMRHYGFRKGQKKPQKRAKEFNEKDDLTSYVLTNKKPLIIYDIEKEAGQYINHRDHKGFHSRIYVPFGQINGAEAVLCAYGKEKNRFVQRDMTVLQILATFLSVNVVDELR